MPRRLKFGMRENPASDRRHGSRLAVSTKSGPRVDEKEDAAAPSPIALADPKLPDPHSCAHAAQTAAATEGKAKDSTPWHAFRLPLADSHEQFEPLLASEPAARLLGNIHVKTLQRYARNGGIPGYRIGGHWYFRASELDAWLRSRLNSSCHPCRLSKEAK